MLRSRAFLIHSALLSKFSVAAFALTLVACSSGERARDENTSTQANNPAGDSETDAVDSELPSAMGDNTGGGVPEAPTASGPDLLVSSGWVDGATNGLEIQGAFFTYQDPTGRTTIAADAAASTSGYCVSGVSAEVLDANFGGTWGAVAALNLRQEVGSTAAGSYDAAAHGVAGFAFDIVGDTGGALRFVIKQFSVHDGFCINNVPDCGLGCSVQYRIDELTQNCWTPGGVLPNAAALQALEWQIVAKAGAETPFDYCIENLHAVMADAPAE
jgi:hypothetical protein